MAEDKDIPRPGDQQQPRPEQDSAAPDTEGGPTAEDVGGSALSEALRWSFVFLVGVMVAAVIFYVLSRLFIVPTGELRVKLRFGRPVLMAKGGGRSGTSYLMDARSGWHILWPWEEAVKIPLTEQTLELVREFSVQPRELTEAERAALSAADEGGVQEGLSVKLDGYLLTGDLNIVHMRLRVLYSARPDEKGALDYALRIQDPAALLRRFVTRATIGVVGSMSANEVMTVKKEELLETIRTETDTLLDRFEQENGFSAGVRVTGLKYTLDPTVAMNVRASYDAAQRAAHAKAKLRDEANTRANEIEQWGQRMRARIIGQAEAYRSALVARAEADAKMMEKLLDDYAASPVAARILRNWHYLRTVEQFIGSAKTVTVLPHAREGRRRQIRLLFGAPRQAQRVQEVEGEQTEQHEEER